MSAAIDIASPSQRESTMAAEVVRGTRSNHPSVDAIAVRLGRRAVILAGADGLELGAFAWVRLTLPDGARIRPLVQVTGDNEHGLACRFVHLFPNERRLLDAYHEARATPHGY